MGCITGGALGVVLAAPPHPRGWPPGFDIAFLTKLCSPHSRGCSAAGERALRIGGRAGMWLRRCCAFGCAMVCAVVWLAVVGSVVGVLVAVVGGCAMPRPWP